ncbi:amidoligase family protein [Halomonas denitrificans]|uniref:amidoligase family protein n=1 Tax=Halomonas TaxID=2745 RepID=UPI001A8C2A10|nr:MULTISPECIES: amidoligase family protein [Halomonas]MED5295023.1 amidoligase family protein [Pseudomonadota bacterium]MBN8413248.1 amidoligase family protein [Halomonas litopenaei]MBY5924180.1 amidoligase family protein [Halomonas sp. DP4Y7-2]MBY5928348.1 amidoligase family protein [Halomonas sp. DP8Y7-3]MBY5982616.1 amidoligase family protein [Halomonas sp. DP5Y7-2]
MKAQAPPEPTTSDGATRKVGVEIEFAGLDAMATTKLVQSLFEGRIDVQSAHRMKVCDTRWGDFKIELDSHYVHPDAAQESAQQDDWERMRRDIDRRSRELLGDMVTGVVPTEIVCPPVPWDELDTLDALFDALRQHGAKGTEASLLYGFGLHLNPELPSLEAADILRYLRAYLLSANWLREQIRVDITREVLPHANPFHKRYCLKLFDPDYAPDIDTLIDDYLADNPTRNRDLDMLPLFAHLRPEHPHELFRKELVQPRPTFHYRLPNAQLSEPDWGAVTEWNRWLEVERLACAPDTLSERMAEYRARHLDRSLWQKVKNTLTGDAKDG